MGCNNFTTAHTYGTPRTVASHEFQPAWMCCFTTRQPPHTARCRCVYAVSCLSRTKRNCLCVRVCVFFFISQRSERQPPPSVVTLRTAEPVPVCCSSVALLPCVRTRDGTLFHVRCAGACFVIAQKRLQCIRCTDVARTHRARNDRSETHTASNTHRLRRDELSIPPSFQNCHRVRSCVYACGSVLRWCWCVCVCVHDVSHYLSRFLFAQPSLSHDLWEAEDAKSPHGGIL